MAPLIAQLVKNLPTMQETWVPSLGWEDTLEKGTATQSSIHAQRILLCPWHSTCGHRVRQMNDFQWALKKARILTEAVSGTVTLSQGIHFQRISDPGVAK